MDWSSELNNRICMVSQLRKYTDLSHDVEMKLNEIIKRHPMCIAPYYMSLIDWDNPSDPIKKIAIHSLTEFNIKKKHVEEKIHTMKSEIGGLHGEMAKAKRRLEEKEKKK